MNSMVLTSLVVERAIPSNVVLGLVTGRYQQYGGVIRWAAGTEHAGQIVRHLVPVASDISCVVPGLNFIPGIAANIQLHDIRGVAHSLARQLGEVTQKLDSLSKVTEVILERSTGTTILSGLALGVSITGFIVIDKKLRAIDQRLQKIQDDIQEVRNFLESSERARLRAAISALLKLCQETAPEHRHTILHNSMFTLSEINMRYRELLSESRTLEEAMAHEEYFVLTSLAQTRCYAELGMLDTASKEAYETYLFWKHQTHRIAREIIIGDHPERFLASDFAQHVSVSEIVKWLDFVFDKSRGYDWIDELRIKMDEPWYSSKTSLNVFALGDMEIPKVLPHKAIGLNKNIGVGIKTEIQKNIPALRKLLSRDQVLDGYVSQYKDLALRNMKPSEFEEAITRLPESSSVSGYYILVPQS